LEDMVVDENGRLLNPNLHDYKMPTAMDAPIILPASFLSAGSAPPRPACSTCCSSLWWSGWG